MLQIEIGNIYSRISGPELTPTLRFALDKDLSYRLKDSYYLVEAINRERRLKAARLRIPFKPTDWDGSVNLYIKRSDTRDFFFSGMIADVVDMLRDQSLPYQFIDRRVRPPPNLPDLRFTMPPGKSERDYQIAAVEMAYVKTRGVIQAGTGSGKTLIVTQIADRIRTAPFLFFVQTRDLLDQAYDVLSSCFNIPIGRIAGASEERGNYCDIQPITVCMVQTAVLALHRADTKMSLAQYRYDDDDAWDEDPTVAQKNGEAIENLMKTAAGIYLDECVTGNSEIITEKGKIRIDQVLNSQCDTVMSYEGRPVFRKIVRFWNKGVRPTVQIRLANGQVLRCTPEHPVGTKRGWISAENLHPGDQVLFANVGANAGSQRPSGDKLDMSLVIKTVNAHAPNGQRSMPAFGDKRPSAPVDAGGEPYQDAKRSQHSSRTKVAPISQLSFSTMTNSGCGPNTTFPPRSLNGKPLLEPVLEIPPSSCPTSVPSTTASAPTTGEFKILGSVTRLPFSSDTASTLCGEPTRGLGNNGPACAPDACQHLPPLQQFFTKEKPSTLHRPHWTQWEASDWLGGFAMMEAIAEDTERSASTPKAGHAEKWKTPLYGFANTDTNVVSARDDQHCVSTLTPPAGYIDASNATSPSACAISWLTVTSVEPAAPAPVYDIEVEGSHCFFANGVLAHNCHHAAAATIREVTMAAKSAYWRFGGSATPFREDGAEKMIQALFSRPFVNISASWLIQRNWLVRPHILNVHIEDGAAGNWKSYDKIYREAIVNNARLHDLTASLVKHFQSKGISTLSLVREYQHGEALQAALPGTPFLRGDMPGKLRREIIAQLRSGDIPNAIGTTLADEGLDVERLGAVLVPGGGQSITRVFQRVGRPMRLFPGKRVAFAVLFHHDGRYLKTHGSRVRNILRSEKEFVIHECSVRNVFDTIDRIWAESGALQSNLETA